MNDSDAGFGTTAPDAAPELSILVVAYNSQSHIEACLASLIRCTPDTRLEILLLDNGTDGTGALVADRFPQVRVIDSIGNVGFGPGNNYLFAHATAPCALVLNPDTVIEDDALTRLLAFLKDKPGLTVVGGRTRLNGVFDAGNRIRLPTLGNLAQDLIGVRERYLKEADDPAATAPYRVQVVVGGFMMMRRETWQALGGFDESFFLYFEEVDLFMRLRALGGEAWIKPDCIIMHDVGSGAKFSESRTRYQLTGQMHYLLKHWGQPKAELGFALICLTLARKSAQNAALGLRRPHYRERARVHWSALREWRSWRTGYRTGGAQSLQPASEQKGMEADEEGGGSPPRTAHGDVA